MKKKVLLICIIAFPSLIYFVFELTQANFKKMAYFGPKTVDAKGDTIYWSVPDVYFKTKIDVTENRSIDVHSGEETVTTTYRADSIVVDTTNYPVYVIFFLDSKLKKDGYKIEGLYDFIKYKPKDIGEVPILFVTDLHEFIKSPGETDSLRLPKANFRFLALDLRQKRDILSETYFKQKPAYVFDYFMVLVDKRRHIRGYYDPSFNAEVKRMIQEYKHLKIRDEYAQTLKKNDIKQNEKK